MSVLFLFGCSTPYRKNTGSGGYSEFRIAENKFAITFQGNSYTTHESVYKYAMLRAATIALRHGYPYFSIHQEKDTSTTTLSKTWVYPLNSYHLHSNPAVFFIIKLHQKESENEDVVEAIRYIEWNRVRDE